MPDRDDHAHRHRRSLRTIAWPLAGSRLVSVLATAVTALAPAAWAAPRVELVATRPVEAAVGHPGLRSTPEVWLEMLKGARHSADLEHFYCSDWPGEPLGPVLDELGRAAARGVRVRLLLDRRFRDTYPLPADSLGRLPNLTLRWVDFGRIAGGVQHAKFMIVDDSVAFVGSQNLDWRALRHIHELGLRIADRRVAGVFGAAFALDWAAADTSGRPAGRDTIAALRRTLGGSPAPPAPFAIALAPGDTARVWPGYSPRGFLPDSARWDLPAMARLLDGAERTIGIQLLTYSPEGRGARDTTLDAALRRAARRGVRVRLLVSDWVMGRGTMIERLRDLARAGVEVRLSTLPPWSGGYIPFARVEHCKYAVVDGDRFWLGTANWEPGYFTGSRNLSVIVAHAGLGAAASEVFATSWAAPSAAPLRMEGDYPEKIRGETPPAGAKVYGR